MRFITTTVLATAPLALAAPHTARSVNTNVVVSYRQDKASGRTSLTVLDEAHTKIIARSCGTEITTGSFAAAPLRINLDVAELNGTLSLGSTSVPLPGPEEGTNGVTCTVGYSEKHNRVECTVPNVAILEDSTLDRRDLPETCFEEQDFVNLLEPEVATIEDPAVVLARDYTPISEAPAPYNMTLGKRQVTCMPQLISENVGNGNPHQNLKRIQISDNVRCNGATCQVEYSQSQQVEYSASIGANFAWSSGGFAVSRSKATGTAVGCQHNGKDVTVCMQRILMHTAYTVQGYWYYPGCNRREKTGGQYILWSPNSSNLAGHYFECQINNCKGLGWQNQEKNVVKKGGPEVWN